MYACGLFGLAAFFGAGPLGPLKPFMGADLRVAGRQLLLFGAACNAVMYGAVGLYQRRIFRLAGRVRVASEGREGCSP